MAMTFFKSGKTYYTEGDQLVFDFHYDWNVRRTRSGLRPYGLTFTFWA
jgi:hypothetical protein